MFRFQLLDYPPLDISTDPFQKPLPRKAISPKSAAAFNACYTDVETAKSPYVSPIFATTNQLSDLPPVLLIVAGYDSLHDEGVKYCQMLKDAGVSVEFHDFPKSVHGFTYNKKDDAKRHMQLWQILSKDLLNYKFTFQYIHYNKTRILITGYYQANPVFPLIFEFLFLFLSRGLVFLFAGS